MATTIDFTSFVDFLETELGLFNNKDFFIRRTKNRTREITDPENFAKITLPTRGFDKTTINSKFIFFVSELKRLNFSPVLNGRKILVKIPKGRNKPSNPSDEGIQPKPATESFEINQKRFHELKDLHRKLPIFGIANRDQPDIGKGIAYFNYFNEEETEKALKLFSEIGFGVEKRAGKECNLTFILMLDSIDTTSLPFGKGKLNGRTIDIFQWIIKKIYRKIIENLPEGVVPGISGRGVIDCGEPEIFQIKKELEEQFGIIMLIHMSARKRSEFFILTTPEATEVYKRFKGMINSFDLISILKNPVAKSESKGFNPKKVGKFLSPTVREFLTKKGYNLKQGEKPYLQFNLKGQAEESEMIISAYNGSLQEKQTVVKFLIPVIQKEFPTAIIKKSPRTSTNISLSIPGYVNTPLRKTKKRKAVAESPAEVIPEVTPTKTLTELSPEEASEAEMELRAIMQDPILRADLSTETLQQAEEFLRRKNTEDRVKNLLAKLTKR